MGKKKKKQKKKNNKPRKDIKKANKDNTKKDNEKVIYCPNCSSNQVKNNHPRNVRVKINIFSAVVVFGIIILWGEISEAFEPTISTYGVVGAVTAGFVIMRVLKSQFQCKKCKFGWDSKYL
ncbi:hypothetical protein [Natranaerofaba carboxydovora]|uniref:hypothetical protein n=1 Tax=Natranaerofaba carboxydovora TaxID=2742683 RepID=UPI001F12D33B|nr:hypothetical protein [Natranaerofaba carboxydovora]UMZ75457.1 hypothetical protein ACONDI_03085 [Natranaerofaba carboxydovora]